MTATRIEPTRSEAAEKSGSRFFSIRGQHWRQVAQHETKRAMVATATAAALGAASGSASVPMIETIMRRFIVSADQAHAAAMRPTTYQLIRHKKGKTMRLIRLTVNVAFQDAAPGTKAELIDRIAEAAEDAEVFAITNEMEEQIEHPDPDDEAENDELKGWQNKAKELLGLKASPR